MLSVASSTWNNYSYAWQLWGSYVSVINLNAMDISERAVLGFLNLLMGKQYSWSHINKLAGVIFFLKLNNLPGCLRFFSVGQALKGYRKVNFTADSRKPLTLLMLRRLCLITAEICFSEYEALLLKPVFTLTFFAALRIFPDSLGLFIPNSKTDIFGKGHWLGLNFCSDVSICPVCMVQGYITNRPNLHTNLFIHIDGTPITKYQFTMVFKKCLMTLNMHHMQFSSHSFRIGAATEAAQIGFNEVKIKNIGRWKSAAYKSYIRPNTSI